MPDYEKLIAEAEKKLASIYKQIEAAKKERDDAIVAGNKQIYDNKAAAEKIISDAKAEAEKIIAAAKEIEEKNKLENVRLSDEWGRLTTEQADAKKESEVLAKDKDDFEQEKIDFSNNVKAKVGSLKTAGELIVSLKNILIKTIAALENSVKEIGNVIKEEK